MKIYQDQDHHLYNPNVLSTTQNPHRDLQNTFSQKSKQQLVSVSHQQTGLINSTPKLQQYQQQKFEADNKSCSYVFQDTSNLNHNQLYLLGNRNGASGSLNVAQCMKASPKKDQKIVSGDENWQQYIQTVPKTIDPSINFSKENKNFQQQQNINVQNHGHHQKNIQSYGGFSNFNNEHGFQNHVPTNSDFGGQAQQQRSINQQSTNNFFVHRKESVQNTASLQTVANSSFQIPNNLYSLNNTYFSKQQIASPNKQQVNNNLFSTKTNLQNTPSKLNINQFFQTEQVSYDGQTSQPNRISYPQSKSICNMQQIGFKLGCLSTKASISIEKPRSLTPSNRNQSLEKVHKNIQNNNNNNTFTAADNQNSFLKNESFPTPSKKIPQCIVEEQNVLNKDQSFIKQIKKNTNNYMKFNENKIFQDDNSTLRQNNIINQQIINNNYWQEIPSQSQMYNSSNSNIQNNNLSCMKSPTSQQLSYFVLPSTSKIQSNQYQQPQIQNQNNGKTFDAISLISKQFSTNDISKNNCSTNDIKSFQQNLTNSTNNQSSHSYNLSNTTNILSQQQNIFTINPQQQLNQFGSQKNIFEQFPSKNKDSISLPNQKSTLQSNLSCKFLSNQTTSFSSGIIPYAENFQTNSKPAINQEISISCNNFGLNLQNDLLNNDGYMNSSKNNRNFNNISSINQNSHDSNLYNNGYVKNNGSINNYNQVNNNNINQEFNVPSSLQSIPPYMPFAQAKQVNSQINNSQISNLSSAATTSSFISYDQNQPNNNINMNNLQQQFSSSMNISSILQYQQNQPKQQQSPINKSTSQQDQRRVSIQLYQDVDSSPQPKKCSFNSQKNQQNIEVTHQHQQKNIQQQVLDNSLNIFSSQNDRQSLQQQYNGNIQKSSFIKEIQNNNLSNNNGDQKIIVKSLLLEKNRRESEQKMSQAYINNSNTLSTEQNESSVCYQKRKYQLQDYDFVKQLGQGVFGQVFMVSLNYFIQQKRDKKTKGIYALKLIDKASIEEREMQAQLKRELQIHQDYSNHTNILEFLASFEDEKYYYILMEYATDGTCAHLLENQPNRRLAEAQSAGFIKQLLEALCYLHSNQIIHRDLKLENVLLSNVDIYFKYQFIKVSFFDKQKGQIKLCDFGCATFCENPAYQRRRSFCGTIDYVSPEMIIDQVYDKEIDIWALGVIAYELNTGFAPFTQFNDQQTYQSIINVKLNYPKNFSEGLKDFLGKVFVTDISKRATAKQLLNHEWVQKGNKQSQKQN